MEILVVITLLAILSTVIMASYFSSLERGRDSRRKQDLEQVARALELYYFENNAYPTPPFSQSNTLPWGFALTSASFTPTKMYMKKLPTDPSRSATIYYYYRTANNNNDYQLYSCLENEKDLDYKEYAGISCGSSCDVCRYGISSSNTTPQNE